jgi:regulatory protein
MTSMTRKDLSAEPGPTDREAVFRAVADRARKLCASREYCISDIRTKIEGWGTLAEGDIEKIIGELTSEKFIDEQRYASAYAGDKLRYNKWGRIKTAYNLRMKGIPSEIITEALANIDEDEYREVALRILKSLAKTSKAADRNQLRAKILRSMQSRGFEYAISAELLKEIL